MSGRLLKILWTVAGGLVIGGAFAGLTAGVASAHGDDWRGNGYRGEREREWRGPDHEWRRHHRHWEEPREPRVIYVPPPPPRVIYAPPPVVYAPPAYYPPPTLGFGFSANIPIR